MKQPLSNSLWMVAWPFHLTLMTTTSSHIENNTSINKNYLKAAICCKLFELQGSTTSGLFLCHPRYKPGRSFLHAPQPQELSVQYYRIRFPTRCLAILLCRLSRPSPHISLGNMTLSCHKPHTRIGKSYLRFQCVW